MHVINSFFLTLLGCIIFAILQYILSPSLVLTSIADISVCVCVCLCVCVCMSVCLYVCVFACFPWLSTRPGKGEGGHCAGMSSGNAVLDTILSSHHSSSEVWSFPHITTAHLNTHTCSCYSVVPAVRSQVLMFLSSPHLISIKWHHSVS